MEQLAAGDLACLCAPMSLEKSFETGTDWMAFLVTNVTQKGVSGVVVSKDEHHRPNPQAVLLTDSRFDEKVARGTYMEGDQLVWLFMPVTVEFGAVKGEVKLERIGRLTQPALQEISRKMAEQLIGNPDETSEEVWEEFENQRACVEATLLDINAVHGSH